LWGQQGDFILELPGVRVRIEMAGLFGIGFPSFAAHIVDPGKPSISETGYRSFLGVGGTWTPGMTPDTFVKAVLEQHIAGELKGRLVAIDPRCYERLEDNPEP
jgi:hypothetical protein